MNYWLTILLVVVILILAIFGLAIQVIFKKTHKFPNTHIGSNKHLKKQGITCAKTWDTMEQKEANKQPKFKNVTLGK